MFNKICKVIKSSNINTNYNYNTNKLLSNIISQKYYSKHSHSHSKEKHSTKHTEVHLHESPYFQVDAHFDDKPEYRDTMDTKRFGIYRCITEEGEPTCKDWVMPVSVETAIKMYRTMILESVFDDIFYKLCRVGQTTFYMQNTGEEACQVASAAAWKPQDVLFFQYRELGTFLYRGYSVDDCAHTNFNNDSGSGRGKQMPVHYGSKDLNCVTISSPLSTQMPQAAGAAYAIKRSGEKDSAVVCYFGDGAASEGDCHTAFNMSATMEVPIVWFCRNNGYAISTPTIDQYRGDAIAARAYAYGMVAVRMDGNDIFASYEVSKEARRIAVEESRPVIVEAMTYRGSHHSTSDDASTYRNKDESEWWEHKGNPIRRMRCFLEKQNLYNETEEKEYYKYCQSLVDKAHQNAQNEKMSHWSELFQEVYYELTPRLQRQLKEMETHLDKYGKESFYKMELHKTEPRIPYD